MTVVVDASAAVDVVTGRARSESLSRLIASANWVIAPDLFVSEVSNVFWKLHRFDNIPLELCGTAIDRAVDLVDDFIDSIELHKEAFALACLTQRTVYDCLYLVAARRHDAILLTVDRKLIDTAKKQSIKVTDMLTVSMSRSASQAASESAAD